MSSIYINGIGAISPQQSFGVKSFWAAPAVALGNRWALMEPDYTRWVDQKAIRRMSHVIRMGVAAAGLALKEAGLQRPDGIITGTGYGCLEDTGAFLSKMVVNQEQSLNPTPFIQSTHNSIGSQVGLLLQCLGYNQTYVQGTFSLESALVDALMQFDEGGPANLLVGGVDEITEASHAILERLSLYRHGAVHGEGAAYFLLSPERQESSYAQLKGVRMVYRPKGDDEVKDKLEKFLDGQGLTTREVDLVLLGSDVTGSSKPGEWVSDKFPQATVLRFKDFCGEYPTAAGFALWLGASILKWQEVPEGISAPANLRTTLVYNTYFDSHHSFILLTSL